MKPYHECPSFPVCSAPKCPLDPAIKMRTFRYPEEEKCRATKPTRHKIGLKHTEVLPYQGYTKREWNGIKRWEALPHAERIRITREGAKRLKSLKTGV